MAPSKIRLRLGAEVDVTITIQIIIIERTKIKTPETKHYIRKEQQDWHLCCHKGGKKYRQARKGEGDPVETGGREKLLCYIKSFVMLGPTGQLVLSANIKKRQRLGALLLKQFSFDLNGTCMATQHEMATLSRTPHWNTVSQLQGCNDDAWLTVSLT